VQEAIRHQARRIVELAVELAGRIATG